MRTNSDTAEAAGSEALVERRAFLDALDGLERVLEENADARTRMLERIAELRGQIYERARAALAVIRRRVAALR